MRTQPTSWFNTQTNTEVFGLKVHHEGQWLNYAENGKPFIVPTEAERDAKRAELRKMKGPLKAAVVKAKVIA